MPEAPGGPHGLRGPLLGCVTSDSCPTRSKNYCLTAKAVSNHKGHQTTPSGLLLTSCPHSWYGSPSPAQGAGTWLLAFPLPLPQLLACLDHSPLVLSSHSPGQVWPSVSSARFYPEQMWIHICPEVIDLTGAQREPGSQQA